MRLPGAATALALARVLRTRRRAAAACSHRARARDLGPVPHGGAPTQPQAAGARTSAPSRPRAARRRPQDMAARRDGRALELVWRGSASWGAASDVWTHNYYTGNYVSRLHLARAG